MTLSTAGNVGIGTTAPQDQLHVYEAGTGAVWRGRGVFGNENINAVIGVYDSKVLVGGHNYALNAWSPLYLNTTTGADGANVIIGGNVGIGVTSPVAKLDVN